VVVIQRNPSLLADDDGVLTEGFSEQLVS